MTKVILESGIRVLIDPDDPVREPGAVTTRKLTAAEIKKLNVGQPRREIICRKCGDIIATGRERIIYTGPDTCRRCAGTRATAFAFPVGRSHGRPRKAVVDTGETAADEAQDPIAALDAVAADPVDAASIVRKEIGV